MLQELLLTDEELEVLCNLVKRRIRNDETRFDKGPNLKNGFSAEHEEMLRWKIARLRGLLDKLERMKLAS